jgi:predicted RNA-binding Zn-ribbon protein involved in translation (DUF1610 family)
METFLICENPKCRFVLDLGEKGRVASRRRAVLNDCPECGHQWSRTCPFCSHPLGVAWPNELPSCSSCHQKLKAEAEAA